MSERPALAYYRPKHGSWTGAYQFAFVSVRALLASPIGLIDKLSLLAMGAAAYILGDFRIDTRMDTSRIEAGTVAHTTRISRLGVTFQSSTEQFVFDADGKRLIVEGVVRTLPFLFVGHPYRESHGEIDADGRGATYHFAWSRARCRQRSTPQADGSLYFTQEFDGCRATFVLRAAP